MLSEQETADVIKSRECTDEMNNNSGDTRQQVLRAEMLVLPSSR